MTHTFKLERLDGTPADPPTLKAAVPNWSARRHDPTWPRQDAPRARRPARLRATTMSPCWWWSRS